MKKRILSLFLSIAMLAVTIFSVNVSLAAEETDLITQGLIEYQKYDDISEFRGAEKTAPTENAPADKAFAGWYYLDSNSKYQPLRESQADTWTETAYAKWVDEDVLGVRYQITAGTTTTSEKTNLRILTSVDSLNYRLAGFEVGINGGTATLTSKTVYEKIMAYTNEQGKEYTASEAFGTNASAYFLAYNITDIPRVTMFDMDFEITAMWTTLDGTTVKGTPKEPFCINDLVTYQPILRFAVASDIHYEANVGLQDQRLAEIFSSAYAYSESQENYKALDAVFMNGDLTTNGDVAILERFFTDFANGAEEGTEVRAIMGNHEYYVSPETAVQDMLDASGYESVDTHMEIGGYHFILISCDINGFGYSQDKLDYLEAELQVASADDPTGTKPIFVFQHHPVNDTCLGSEGSTANNMGAILENYPQVVDFSSHSHAPINDPRSIWQESYTVLNTGACTLLGVDVVGEGFAHPIDSEGGYHSEYATNVKDAAQYYIIEVDSNHTVRVQAYDMLSDSFMYEPIYLESFGDASKFQYTDARKDAEEKAVFAEDAAEQIQKQSLGTTMKLTFPQVENDVFINHYRCELYNGETKIDTQLRLGCHFYLPTPETLTVSFDNLEVGVEYTVKITPITAWGNEGETLVYDFTTDGTNEDPNPTVVIDNPLGLDKLIKTFNMPVKAGETVVFDIDIEPAQATSVWLLGDDLWQEEYYAHYYSSWTGKMTIFADVPEDTANFTIAFSYKDTSYDLADGVTTISNIRIVSDEEVDALKGVVVNPDGSVTLNNPFNETYLAYTFKQAVNKGDTITFDIDVDPAREMSVWLFRDGVVSSSNEDYAEWYSSWSGKKTISVTAKDDMDSFMIRVAYRDLEAESAGTAADFTNRVLTISNVTITKPFEADFYEGIDMEVKEHESLLTRQDEAAAHEIVFSRVQYASEGISTVDGLGTYGLKGVVGSTAQWPGFYINYGESINAGTGLSFMAYVKADDTEASYTIGGISVACCMQEYPLNEWFEVRIVNSATTESQLLYFDIGSALKGTGVTVYMDNFRLIPNVQQTVDGETGNITVHSNWHSGFWNDARWDFNYYWNCPLKKGDTITFSLDSNGAAGSGAWFVYNPVTGEPLTASSWTQSYRNNITYTATEASETIRILVRFYEETEVADFLIKDITYTQAKEYIDETTGDITVNASRLTGWANKTSWRAEYIWNQSLSKGQTITFTFDEGETTATNGAVYVYEGVNGNYTQVTAKTWSQARTQSFTASQNIDCIRLLIDWYNSDASAMVEFHIKDITIQ